MLMDRAVTYLQSIGVETIWLEAVPKAITLYQRLGFVEDFDSFRFSKELKPEVSQPQYTKGEVYIIEKEDLEELAVFDSRYFGANRRKVLERIHRDYPQYCFVAKEGEKMLGYIMARETSKGYWIGPWVRDHNSSEKAKTLILSCLCILDKKAEVKLGMSS